MKKLIVLFVLVLSFLAFETQAQGKSGKAGKAEKAEKAVKAQKGKALGNQQVTFSSSMQCDMCKDKIEKALALTKGVKSSEIDVKANQISITYNSKKVSAEDLQKVITQTGYDADDMEANKASHDKLPKCCRKSGE